ncbi:MAG: hypothetical protein ACK6BN_04625 [Pseudanabaena sp.]|jgi:hypothetical protein
MPAPDRFGLQRLELHSPLAIGFPITPNDSNDLSQMTREMFFAGAGNVRVTWAGQPDGTFSTHAVLAGERVAWRVSRVWATGTTATGIEGFA